MIGRAAYLGKPSLDHPNPEGPSRDHSLFFEVSIKVSSVLGFSGSMLVDRCGASFVFRSRDISCKPVGQSDTIIG